LVFRLGAWAISIPLSQCKQREWLGFMNMTVTIPLTDQVYEIHWRDRFSYG